MKRRMPKNYTALKLPKVDFRSKLQCFISNRSRVLVGEKNIFDMWMDKSKSIECFFAFGRESNNQVTLRMLNTGDI